MIRVPLSTFVEFACSTGARKVAIVKDLKGGLGYDFYAPFSAEVRGMHERAGSLLPEVAERELPALLESAVAKDRRRATIYPKLVAGYLKTIAELGPTTWEPADPTMLTIGDIEVEVAPELGLVVERDTTTKPRAHIAALYFHGEVLAEQRAQLTVFLMWRALAPHHPTAVFGALDVQRSRLLTPTVRPETSRALSVLVRGEAASFEKMWAGL